MTSPSKQSTIPVGLSSAGAVADPTLSAATRAGLRAVAAERAASGDVAARVAALVVADARRRAVTAEHMIIAVKREWSALDEVRRIGTAAEARALLDRLVTRCIDAFYSSR